MKSPGARPSAALYEQLLDLYHERGVQVFPMSLLKKLAPEGARAEHLRIIAARFVKSGRLVRLARGLFTLRRAAPTHQHIMQALDPAAYISLESRLSSASILQQGIAITTCVTPNRDRAFDIRLAPAGSARRIRFHHLDAKFFTFGIENGYEMEPEKALLDLIHIRLFSRRPPLPGGNWNIERLDRKKLAAYAEKYPAQIRAVLGNFLEAKVGKSSLMIKTTPAMNICLRNKQIHKKNKVCTKITTYKQK